MLKVGLTGGIGSGKSTVSARLAELGAVILDADKAARAVVEPGTPGLAAITEAFGSGVLAADGSLDRAELAAIVFADEAALGTLNGITHPLIHEYIRAAEEAAIDAGGDDVVLVHDIALLAEGGRGKEFDLVIVVDVPAETQLERLAGARHARGAGAGPNGGPGDPRAAPGGRRHRDRQLRAREDLDRRVDEVWAALQARAAVKCRGARNDGVRNDAAPPSGVNRRRGSDGYCGGYA